MDEGMAGTGRCRSERGASILELALLAPVMVLIVMGVVDLARGYRMQIQLENAAREGAAFAQTQPNSVSCPDGDDIIERVVFEEAGVEALPDFRIEVWAEDDAGELTVPVTGCGGTTAAAGDRLLVAVSATFDVLTPMVERVVGSGIEITGAAEIGVQG